MTQYNRRPGQTQRPAPRPAQPQRRTPAAPARRAPQASPSRGPLFPRPAFPAWAKKLLLTGIAMVAVAVGLQFLMPGGFPLATRSHTGGAAAVQEITSVGPIRINEVMSSNTGALASSAGETADWVEIANAGSSPVGIGGWSLAKSMNAGAVFTFPNITLQPGEVVIIFCDGGVNPTEGGEYHAPFRLSSKGDTLMLFNAADTAVDTVNLPAMDSNASYARQDDGSWSVTRKSTPGEPNTEEGYLRLTTAAAESSVEITEVMPANKTIIRAGDGGVYDYVEIHNASGEEIDLSGYWLSDSVTDKFDWRFPDGAKLPADGYLTVFCSGLDKVDGAGQYHTSFRLSSGGETVVLTNRDGYPVSVVTFGPMADDAAWCLIGGEWKAATPTPGKAN